jgi:hypothetical protein
VCEQPADPLIVSKQYSTIVKGRLTFGFSNSRHRNESKCCPHVHGGACERDCEGECECEGGCEYKVKVECVRGCECEGKC